MEELSLTTQDNLETDRYYDLIKERANWPEGLVDVIEVSNSDGIVTQLQEREMIYQGQIEFDLPALAAQYFGCEKSDHESYERLSSIWHVLTREDKVEIAALRRSHFDKVNEYIQNGRPSNGLGNCLRDRQESLAAEAIRWQERAALIVEKSQTTPSDDPAAAELPHTIARAVALAHEHAREAAELKQILESGKSKYETEMPGIEFVSIRQKSPISLEISAEAIAEIENLLDPASETSQLIAQVETGKGPKRLKASLSLKKQGKLIGFDRELETLQKLSRQLQRDEKTLARYENYLFNGDEVIIEARTAMRFKENEIEGLQKKAAGATAVTAASAAVTAAVGLDKEKTGNSAGNFVDTASKVATFYSATKALEAHANIYLAKSAAQKLENEIALCQYIQRHPLRVALLKKQVDASRARLAEAEKVLGPVQAYKNKVASYASSLTHTAILGIAATAIALVIIIPIGINVASRVIVPTASSAVAPTSPSAHSQTPRTETSSSEHSQMPSTGDSTEETTRREKAPIPSSHVIETPYYTAKVPDATDGWTYDYVNAYSTKGWDGEGGLGYITYVYRNDVLTYEIACFGGAAAPKEDAASTLVGTLDVPDTGELSVFAIVSIDREGPNADVAESNAADEANYYAENVSINPTYATAAAQPADPVGDDEYILPASDSTTYTREELEGLSDWELYIARNEIFARRGRQFSNADLIDYFEARPWYNGEYEPADFDSWFTPNEFEKANTDLILEVERGRNSPYLN
ncbi:YARHG domain-containing protein [Eggerthellaceae bacterium 24-137]